MTKTSKHLTSEEQSMKTFDAQNPVHARLLAKAGKRIEDNRVDIGQCHGPDIFDPDNPKHAGLLKVMKLEHPDMPEYILVNSLRFYLAGCLPEPGQKRRGRPPKTREQPTEIRGAVTIS